MTKDKPKFQPHKFKWINTHTFGRKPLREAKSIGRSRYAQALLALN